MNFRSVTLKERHQTQRKMLCGSVCKTSRKRQNKSMKLKIDHGYFR